MLIKKRKNKLRGSLLTGNRGTTPDTMLLKRKNPEVRYNEAIESIVAKNYALDEEDTERKFQFIADSLEAQQQDDDEEQLDMFEGFITSFSLIADSKFKVKETLKRFAEQFLLAIQEQSAAFCQGLVAGLLFANKAIELSQEALLDALRQSYAVYERFKSHWLEVMNANTANKNMSNGFSLD